MEFLLNIITTFSVIVLALFGISLIPIGVYVRNAPIGLDVRLKFGVLQIPILSSKKKQRKKDKDQSKGKQKSKTLKKNKRNKNSDTEKSASSKKKKNATSKKSKKNGVDSSDTPKKIKGRAPKAEELLGFVALIQSGVSFLLESLDALGAAKRVRQLELDLVIGDSDPVKATMMYGQAHALLGTIWIPLDQGLDIEEGRARVSLMYEEMKPALYGTLDTTITIGKLVQLGIMIGKKGYHLMKNK